MITWPAILKYDGENELVFILNQAQWNKDPDLFYYAYESDDFLLDSDGMIYRLDQIEDHFVTPVADNRNASIEEVIDMLKAHMSELGHCCIAKISLNSIKEAIDMVGELEEID